MFIIIIITICFDYLKMILINNKIRKKVSEFLQKSSCNKTWHLG